MIKSAAMALAVAMLVSACASNKTPVPTGGSRSDGTIRMSYEVGMFEEPVVDWSAAARTAGDRCKAWGYQRAEAFGGQTQQCQAYNGYGNCLRAVISIDYQCIGNL